MDCVPPGSSVPGVLQARILEWVAVPFSRDKSSTLTGTRASLETQMVKNPLAMQETWVQSLGQEDSLEKGMATNSSTPAWRIPGIGEPAGYSPQGHKEWDTTE